VIYSHNILATAQQKAALHKCIKHIFLARLRDNELEQAAADPAFYEIANLKILLMLLFRSFHHFRARAIHLDNLKAPRPREIVVKPDCIHTNLDLQK
jgi:hypothetical protein